MADIIEIRHIDLNGGQITKPRWSLDGRFLAIPMESGSIAIFDLDLNQVVQTVGHHSAQVTAVGWNREAQFIMTGSLDRSVGVWEVPGGRKSGITISGHKEPVHSVEWTDEGAFAMTCSADRVRALDGFCLERGWTTKMEDSINKYNGFTAASCSSRTTFLLGLAAKRGTVLVLTSLLTADVLDHVRMERPIQSLAWSPKEDLLTVAAGQSIFAFRATQEGFKGSPRELTRNAPYVDALAFSGDGTLLVYRDAHGLNVWDVQAGRSIAALDENIESPSRRHPTSGIAFHPVRPLVAALTPNGIAVRLLEITKLA